MKKYLTLLVLLSTGFPVRASAEAGMEVLEQYAQPQIVTGMFRDPTRIDYVVSRPTGGSEEGDYHELGELFYYQYDGSDDTGLPRRSIFGRNFPVDGFNWARDRFTVEDIAYDGTYPDIRAWWDAGLSIPSYLGFSLAVGDFNDDGLDDLAVGIPAGLVIHEGVVPRIAGYVLILFGGPDFPHESTNVMLSQDSPSTWSYAEDYDFFGFSLAAGDYNCDGFDDIAVGVPFESTSSQDDYGGVQIFWGSSIESNIPSNSGFQSITQSDVGYDREENEQFGFSLAAGHFGNAPNHCDSLAVGSPGDEIDGEEDAGRVFVFYAEEGDLGIDRNDNAVIDQIPLSVTSDPQAGDRFGEVIGTIKYNDNYDDLWIQSPGDEFDPLCGDDDRLGRNYYQVFYSYAYGIDHDDDRREYCGIFPPNVLEKAGSRHRRRGVVHEYGRELGSIALYVPADLSSSFYTGAPENNAALLIQGRPGPCDEGTLQQGECDPSGTRYLSYPNAWRRSSDNSGIVLVSPTNQPRYFATGGTCVWNHCKGVTWPPKAGKDDWRIYGHGYEGLSGSDGERRYRFDHYLNDILDDLALVGLGTEQVKAFGHSGGGRALHRYLWTNPDRVERAIVESPGSLLWNRTDSLWPYGLGSHMHHQEWPDSSGNFVGWDAPVFVEPASMAGVAPHSFDEHWTHVLSRPIAFFVGGDEADCRLCMLEYWKDGMNYQFVPEGSTPVDYCILPGVGHNSHAMSSEASFRLLESDWSSPWAEEENCAGSVFELSRARYGVDIDCRAIYNAGRCFNWGPWSGMSEYWDCGDGVDNDGDGWVDLKDPDCALSITESGMGTTRCNDGRDNDGDGDVDSDDAQCIDGTDNSERFSVRCSNGVDDDGDGDVDLEDSCCHGVRDANEGTTTCCDGTDNDGDGWTDLDDPDCIDSNASETGDGPTECNDGHDNDGDGSIDGADDCCDDAFDNTEDNAICCDGVDNDDDGDTDFGDLFCIDSEDRSEDIEF